MKECRAAASEYKCINCITYNRYNKKEKINENHMALSKDCPNLKVVLTRYISKECPSLKVVLTRYKNNIEYYHG